MNNGKSTFLFFSFLILTILTASIFTVHAQSSLSVTGGTGSSTCFGMSEATISSKLILNGSPKTDALVGVAVNDHNNDSVIVRTLGAVQPSPLLANITSFFPSDANGNPVNPNFQTGSLPYFNVTCDNYNIKPSFVALTISVFDCNNTLLDSPGITLEVPARSEYSWVSSVNIPSWAAPSMATPYASAFSDLISNRGTPYCKEVATQFTINNQQNAGQASAFIGNGWYNLTYRIPQNPIVGNYTVYASSANGGLTALNSNTFLVTYIGDLNGNLKVNYTHIILFMNAYIAYWSKGIYNPRMDFNHDGKIDYKDLIIFVNSYIAYWNGQS